MAACMLILAVGAMAGAGRRRRGKSDGRQEAQEGVGEFRCVQGKRGMVVALAYH